MRVKLPCGCTIDDEHYSTIHEKGGRHYPIGTNPRTFCLECDQFRPCLCPVTKAKIDLVITS